MKRTLASILASAMMLFALAGCAGGNAPADSTNQNDTAEESSQAAEPITISVGVPTAPPAGSSHDGGAAAGGECDN